MNFSTVGCLVATSNSYDQFIVPISSFFPAGKFPFVLGLSLFDVSFAKPVNSIFTETTTRHHIEVDGEYVALDILDTAGKVKLFFFFFFFHFGPFSVPYVYWKR